MKTVLVPVDGSDCTELTVAKGREMADFYNARLVIMHVYDMPTMRSYFDFDKDFRETNVLQDLRNRSQKTLDEARASIPDFSDDGLNWYHWKATRLTGLWNMPKSMMLN